MQPIWNFTKNHFCKYNNLIWSNLAEILGRGKKTAASRSFFPDSIVFIGVMNWIEYLMVWFLYDSDLCQERVNAFLVPLKKTGKKYRSLEYRPFYC